jgi:hypothetical protein
VSASTAAPAHAHAAALASASVSASASALASASASASAPASALASVLASTLLLVFAYLLKQLPVVLLKVLKRSLVHDDRRWEWMLLFLMGRACGGFGHEKVGTSDRGVFLKADAAISPTTKTGRIATEAAKSPVVHRDAFAQGEVRP